MDKKLFLIISLLSLILNSKCEENHSEEEEEDWEEGDDYDDFEGDDYFKHSLKEYLVANKLFDSDRLIKRDEMKKIFLDVISDGDPEGAPGYMESVFHDLTEYFVNTYYKDRPQIRGKDLYDLIDINEISMKFEQMMGDNPYYNGYEEEKDFDNRDVVGEPSPDV